MATGLATSPVLGDLDRRGRHRERLTALGRCPSCAELVGPAVLFRGADCPRCGAPPDPHEAGERVADVLTRRGRRHLLVVCALIFVSNFLLGWIPLLEVVTLTAAALWLRLGVIVPSTRVMAPRRRMVATWTARLLVGVLLAVTLVFAQLVMLLGPVAGPIKAVLGAAQVGVSAALVTTYLHWQLRREQRGTPVGAAEYALLSLAAGMLCAAVLGFAFALFAALRALDWMLGVLAA